MVVRVIQVNLSNINLKRRYAYKPWWVANTIIGNKGHRGVSSGELYLVSIEIDLVHDPIILFLDKPTSNKLLSLAALWSCPSTSPAIVSWVF